MCQTLSWQLKYDRMSSICFSYLNDLDGLIWYNHIYYSLLFNLIVNNYYCTRKKIIVLEIGTRDLLEIVSASYKIKIKDKDGPHYNHNQNSQTLGTMTARSIFPLCLIYYFHMPYSSFFFCFCICKMFD